jgi:hypothetical protein
MRPAAQTLVGHCVKPIVAGGYHDHARVRNPMSNTETCRDVIRRLYGPALALRPESEEEIRRGEAILERPLPKVLSDYYRFSGHGDRLNQVQDRLLAPTRLQSRDGAVVFYDENQGVVRWGVLEIDWNQDDPPVYYAANESKLEWKFDHARLSDFFVTMAYWQAVNGALENIALGTGESGHLAEVERLLPEIKIGENRWDCRIFSRERQVCFHYDGGPTQVAGRTIEDRDSLMDLIPIEWDLVEPEPEED